MYRKNQLKNDLLQLGIAPGDKLLIHSSFKSMGEIEGGAHGFFEAVTEVLGEKGTLLLPTLSFDYVTREQPIFDVNTTPSCIGYLPEYFRTQFPGVIRSLHPTHSCAAYGKYAMEFVKEHELDLTPVGPHSPFAKLPQMGGKILMLGCHPDHNTSMHGVEETAEPPYLFDRTQKVHYTIKKQDGTILEQEAFRHHFRCGNIVYGQKYSRILELLDESEVRYGKILEAESVLMSAVAVWKKGKEALLKDPYFFVHY